MNFDIVTYTDEDTNTAGGAADINAYEVVMRMVFMADSGFTPMSTNTDVSSVDQVTALIRDDLCSPDVLAL